MDNFGKLVELLIKLESEGKPKLGHLLQIGNTPKYLIKYAGFPALPLAIKYPVISKICFDHGISTSFIKALPKIIATPKAIFKPSLDHHNDTIVVLTFKLKGSNSIVIPIQKNQISGRHKETLLPIHYNLIKSMYAKEGYDPMVKWHDDGLLIWKPTDD